MFLKSQPQRFITEPGATKYFIGTGAAPGGCVNTGLSLSDVASIVPDSVFDLTNACQLTQDSAVVKNQDVFLYKDGNPRTGRPKSYGYWYNDPGVFHLFPIPDNQNLYYPVPASPLLGTVAGGVLGQRTYYVVATFVDSLNNEGTASPQPSTIYVPFGQLLQVQSPEPEIPSGTNVTYGYWNVYVGTSFTGPFWKQNLAPIPIGEVWTESNLGFITGLRPAQSFSLGSPNGTMWNISAQHTGTLVATPENPGPFVNYYLVDTNRVTYGLQINNVGTLSTTVVPGPQPALSAPILLDDGAGTTWQVTVSTGGLLVATPVGPTSSFTLPSNNPPTNPTITPISGYVIGFQYQQERKQIANTTDVLQIPFQYFDVVVAGVNYFANLYTSKPDDLNVKVAVWKKEFMDGLAQIRRDLRVNFRNTDVIMPDRATQYHINGQSFYYGQ